MDLLPSWAPALFQVIMIDLLLAADNAILVGLVAANVPKEFRKRVIALGVIFATILRIFFAVIVTHLLEIIGLLFAGGLLLLWVAWKMWRELQNGNMHPSNIRQPKTITEAVWLIVMADVAMSLDNVLGVAGAAREHLWVLITGLSFSVLLMAVASTYIARLLTKYKWLMYFGLLIIVQVALKMIWDGGLEVWLVSREYLF